MLYLCHLLITFHLSPVCKFRDNTTLKIFLNVFPELLKNYCNMCVCAEYLHMFDFSKCFANKFIWQATQDAKKSALQIYIKCFFFFYKKIIHFCLLHISHHVQHFITFTILSVLMFHANKKDAAERLPYENHGRKLTLQCQRRYDCGIHF